MRGRTQGDDLREKRITGAVEGRGVWLQRRATERGAHKGTTHKENISPKATGVENERG